MVEKNKKNKKHESRAVASKLIARIETMIEQDRKARELDRGKKMLRIARRGLAIMLIIPTMACSLADPSAGGNSSGADAYLYSVPEAGYVERTTRITRVPVGDPTASGGTMYNRRSWTDWLYGRTPEQLAK